MSKEIFIILYLILGLVAGVVAFIYYWHFSDMPRAIFWLLMALWAELSIIRKGVTE